MKNFFKSIIKILFVVIIPIGFICGVYKLLNTYDTYNTGIMFALILVGIAVMTNAIMFVTYMSKVRMLPKATIEILPIFGFAFGVDPNRNNGEINWILLLPFISIEFTSKK